MIFGQERKNTGIRGGLEILRLIFHTSVRELRKTQGNAMVGLLISILQSTGLLLGFYLMFAFTGLRSMAPRGDYVIYLLTGIFLFFAHVRAVTAVGGADGPTSALMKHSPMTTTIAICGAALATLYTQILSILVILFVYHAVFVPISLHDWLGCLMMLMLAWLSGVAIGTVFLALHPWVRDLSGMLRQGYVRITILASGKMFLANMMPGQFRALMDWNPLYHIIDQTRGFAFINYVPHYSNLAYPLKVTLVCLVIGLLGEFYTRKHASLSWGARGIGQ